MIKIKPKILNYIISEIVDEGNNNPWIIIQDFLNYIDSSLSWFDGNYYLSKV